MTEDSVFPPPIYGCNITNQILEVSHKDLESTGESLYRKKCPICKRGLLLVGRDNKTFQLEEYDNCILCGQKVRYLDINELRQAEGMDAGM